MLAQGIFPRFLSSQRGRSRLTSRSNFSWSAILAKSLRDMYRPPLATCSFSCSLNSSRTLATTYTSSPIKHSQTLYAGELVFLGHGGLAYRSQRGEMSSLHFPARSLDGEKSKKCWIQLLDYQTEACRAGWRGPSHSED